MNTFGQHLSSFVNTSIQQGVPLPEIVLTLDMCKLELQLQMLTTASDKQAQADQPVIVLPTSNGRAQ